MLELVRECGWPSYGIMVVAFCALVASAGSLVLSMSKQGKLGFLAGIVAVSLALLAIGGGYLGRMSNRRKVEAVASEEGLAGHLRGQILSEGYKEAETCVSLSVSLATPVMLLALGTAGVGFFGARRRRRLS